MRSWAPVVWRKRLARPACVMQRSEPTSRWTDACANRTTAVCADCQLGDAKRGRARRASCGAGALRRDLPETERTERRRIDPRRVQTTGTASLSGSVQRTRGGSNPHLLSHFYQSRVYHKALKVARVFVRFDHVASVIVNANHGIF